ncbi:MAG: DoxX family protein [Saprospiraceae bacterium]|nr:DoxX family protein [Saprospiraceae bacterium]
MDMAALLLRLIFGGFMLLGHGLGKWDAMMAGSETFPDPLGLGAVTSLYLAVFAEVICAGLLVIGLASRWILIPLIITMLVAVFIVHGEHEWFAKGGPSKEAAAIYLMAYISLFFTGAGKYSLDGILYRRGWYY